MASPPRMTLVPYGNFIEATLLFLLLASPVLVVFLAVRVGRLQKARYCHPYLLAGVELAIVVSMMALVVVTVGTPTTGGRSLDLNPLVGISGTDAFRSLFFINFVLIPMPLAAIVVTRFNRLSAFGAALAGSTAVFLLVETAQFLRGGRVASTQDVLLSVVGATLAATFFGRLVAPLSRELLRTRGTPLLTPARLGRVSRIRVVVTGLAILGPLAWTFSLPTPRIVESTSSPDQGGDSACGLPSGDWAVPIVAPQSEWIEVGHKVLPISKYRFGPVRPRNEVRCFARNPTGALFAAAWALQRRPETATRIAGFRFEAANPDIVELALLLEDHGKYTIASGQVRWNAGDWQATIDPEALRTDVAVEPNDFVDWGSPG